MSVPESMNLSRITQRGTIQGRLSVEDILQAHYKSSGASNVTGNDTFAQIGIFHRTLLHDPSVRWAFNARLRHSRLNDIVIVGENAVHIKSVVHDSEGVHLAHVASKFDFSSSIRAANIVGTPFVPAEGLPINHNMFNGPLGAEVFPPNMLVLALADGDAVFLVAKVDAATDHVVFSTSSIPLPQLPHVGQPGASITVDNGANVVAFAAHDGFVELLKLKNQEDVAQEFLVNRSNWSPVLSVRPLHTEAIEGSMLHLTFLTSEDKLPNVSLLAMVAKIRNRPHLLCWQGDLFSGQMALEPFIKESPLDDVKNEDFKYGCAHPDLMIPYSNSPGFVLACGSTLHLYSIVSGNVVSDFLETHPDIDPRLEPQNPEMFQEFPRFAAFSFCFRSHHYKQRKREIFYLLREDGVLLSIEIDPSIGRIGLGCRLAAKLHCYGSEAMVTFLTSGTLADPDRIAVIGDMSDGRVLSIGETQAFNRQEAMAPRTLQILPNWSPVLDMALIPPKSVSVDGAGMGSVFITSSRQPHGTISQLFSGCKAIVSVTVPVPDLEEAGLTTGLWTAMDDMSGNLYHFVSFVDFTIVLSGSIHELSLSELPCQTLTIAKDKEMILHVSPNRLTLFTTESLKAEPVTTVAHVDFKSPAAILVAASVAMEAAVVVAHRRQDGAVSIGLYRAVPKTEAEYEYMIASVGQVSDGVSYVPTSLAIFEHDEQYYAIVGTSAGAVVALSVSDSVGVVEIGRFQWEDTASTPQANVIESLGILGDETSSDYVLVCGLRGGSIRHVLISLVDSPTVIAFEAQQAKHLDLGVYPVIIATDPNSTHTEGFATCGPSIIRISKPHHSSELEFHNIWFHDENEEKPGFRQPESSSICIVPTLIKRSVAPLEVAVFSKEGLFMAVVNHKETSLQFRRIPLSLHLEQMGVKVEKGQSSVLEEAGTPQKLLHLAALDSIVVTVKKMEVVPIASSAERSTWAGKRSWKSSLIFVPLKAAQRSEDPSWRPFYADPRDHMVIELGKYEQVTCMCEWEWRKNNSGGTRKQLLVATSIKAQDSTDGRLYFLDLRRDSAGSLNCKIAKVKSLKRPIKAMAVLNTTRLVVCDSEGLDVYGLAKDDEGLYRKWKSFAHCKTQDSCRAITTEDPLVHVTGSAKSIVVYRYDDNYRSADGVRIGRLTKVFGDEMARPAFSHLLLKVDSAPNNEDIEGDSRQHSSLEHKFILVASENKKLAVISHPGEVGPEASAFANSRTLVDTSLPNLITRLAIAPLRPPWLKNIAHPVGVIGPDVIGSSPAGSITHIRMLDSRASHLLKYLQNLVYYDNMGREAFRIHAANREHSQLSFKAPVIDPLPRVANDFLHEYHATSGKTARNAANTSSKKHSVDPSTFAIDGDMLDILVQASGRAKLMHLLTQDTWETTISSVDSESADEAQRNLNAKEQRLKRFVRIVEVVLGATPHENDEQDFGAKNEDNVSIDEDNDENQDVRAAIDRCISWLKDIWQFL